MSAKHERRTRGEIIRVLVVDDEADIRELLNLTLVRMGLAADSADSVAEAKRLLADGNYNLCLTDMRLPDGEGLDLVRHIGEHYHDLPVAVITAYGSMENAVSALKSGAFDYLAKPVSLEQFAPWSSPHSNCLSAPRAGYRWQHSHCRENRRRCARRAP